MRIIAGNYRGKKLISPQRGDVRPTADRAREAVFNILNSRLDSAWPEYHLLDLFAGTGAFALEALSRGAASVCLVDINPADARKNTALFPREQNKITLLSASAVALPPAARQFNLLFSDAPYKRGLSEPALISAYEQGWLAPGALCVVELEKNEVFAVPEAFELIDRRVYGLAQFLFLRLS